MMMNDYWCVAICENGAILCRCNVIRGGVRCRLLDTDTERETTHNPVFVQNSHKHHPTCCLSLQKYRLHYFDVANRQRYLDV